MQRVANCVLQANDRLLLLQKPRRGWWVAPGGKMEPGETVKESVIREFREETGVHLLDPELKAVSTVMMKDEDAIVSEWMMFTFYANQYEGKPMEQSREGRLVWQPKGALSQLAMAEGDYSLLDFCLHGSGIMFAAFTYTLDFQLLASRVDHE